MEQRLYICCNDRCIDYERRKILRAWRMTEPQRRRLEVVTPEFTVEFVNHSMMLPTVRSGLYHGIYTCDNVRLTHDQIDLLRTRLIHPADWSGSFPQIPASPSRFKGGK